MFPEIDLSVFPEERRRRLESIYRYNSFEVLFYRSNLWMHTHRVLWLLEEIIPLAQKYFKFDVEKARAYALVHDDAEMITGDIVAIRKLRMSPTEIKKHQEEELSAIKDLSARFPKTVNGYSYEKLLLHAAKKDCIEAQLVSYLDKLDSYCESLHEVYAGNLSLLRSVVFNANATALFPSLYPKLKEFLLSRESPFTYLRDQLSPYEIKIDQYKNLGRPYTKEIILLNPDFPFYKRWKEILIERGRIDWLIEQREFLD